MEKTTAKEFLEKLRSEGAERGYSLNPDDEFNLNLSQGMLTNIDRYGKAYCPCRLVRPGKASNIDIICPCTYRDEDISQYGACFCGLYINPKTFNAKRQVPDRHLLNGEAKMEETKDGASIAPKNLKYPVWRCKVCGYLSANEHPPATCPICHVDSERFERFM